MTASISWIGFAARLVHEAAAADIETRGIRRRFGVWGWLGFLVVVATALVGCDSVRELTQRCAKGDATACESACDEGVFGEGGCFRAGQAAYRQAGTDYAGPELHRAKGFFKKSCEGGHADGCLFVAQLVEAPFSHVTQPKAAPETAVAAIDDAAIDERRTWLERACDQRSAKGCQRLGDVTIGKKPEMARLAYEQACELGDDAERCKKARLAEVRAFEHYRNGCRRGIADDCTALGNVVFRVDFPRAIRLFLAELELRGLAEKVGGARAFVERRIKEARTARVIDPGVSSDEATPRPSVLPPSGSADKPSVPSPGGSSASEKKPSVVPPSVDGGGSTDGPPRPPSVKWSSLKVEGRLARTFVERALSAAEPRLLVCARGEGIAGRDPIRVRLLVDRTGDVFSAEVEGERGRVSGCLKGALEAVQMHPPVSGIAHVERTLSFEPVEDPEAASDPGR